MHGSLSPIFPVVGKPYYLRRSHYLCMQDIYVGLTYHILKIAYQCTSVLLCFFFFFFSPVDSDFEGTDELYHQCP